MDWFDLGWDGWAIGGVWWEFGWERGFCIWVGKLIETGYIYILLFEMRQFATRRRNSVRCKVPCSIIYVVSCGEERCVYDVLSLPQSALADFSALFRMAARQARFFKTHLRHIA